MFTDTIFMIKKIQFFSSRVFLSFKRLQFFDNHERAPRAACHPCPKRGVIVDASPMKYGLNLRDLRSNFDFRPTLDFFYYWKKNKHQFIHQVTPSRINSSAVDTYIHTCPVSKVKLAEWSINLI